MKLDELDEVDEVDEVEVDAFDEGTCILTMADGSLRLRVPLMPPSWPCRDGAFDSFEDTLTAALGVEVTGLDKEFFAIEKPAPDTIARLRGVLLQLRRDVEIGDL